MIKVVSYTKTAEMQPNEFYCTIHADTKAEVTESAEIIGLDPDSIIAQGSALYTNDGNVAFRTSEDSWAWQ